jgi:hypothetical protein
LWFEIKEIAVTKEKNRPEEIIGKNAVSLLASLTEETLEEMYLEIGELLKKDGSSDVTLPEFQKISLLEWLSYIEEEMYYRMEQSETESEQKKEAKEITESIINGNIIKTIMTQNNT